MEISNNSSSEARTCWKRFYWRYNQKLTPIRQAPALTLGRIIHGAFDQYYTKTPIPQVISGVSDQFDEEINNSAPEEAERVVSSKFTALGMLSYYPYPPLSDFEEIHSEKQFRIKIMRGVWFIGRIDGLVKKRGQYWLREIKTTSQTQRQFNQRISSSSQATAYCWAMKELGYDVKGIMFDFLKKPLLRKRVGDDQYSFGARVIDDYKKRPDFYFGQIYAYRTDNDLKIWRKDTESLARDMIGKRRSLRYYRDTNSCYHYNFECPYKKICFEDKPDPLMLQLYFKRDGKVINA